MVQGPDTHVRVEAADASQQRGDDGEDDLSEPLINIKRTVGRKVSVGSKNNATVMKKNNLVSKDILEGQKSASFLADEGRTPSAAKTMELLVYRRTRFRGAKASLEVVKTQGARVDNLAPSRVVEVADKPTSTQHVNGINDRESVKAKGKKGDLNHVSQVLARKEHMNMRRKRQKARVALRRSGMSMPRQLMMSFQGPATPLLMAMPLFTAQNVPLGDDWSEEELDALWIGVRRHGEGKWESIMSDTKLQFSSYKKPEDLFKRWTVEKVKALGVDRIQEPLRHPEHQLAGEVHPRVPKLARGTLMKRSLHRKDKIAAGSSKKQTLMLGGAFPLSNAIIRKFKGKEVSSEGTITDYYISD